MPCPRLRCNVPQKKTQPSLVTESADVAATTDATDACAALWEETQKIPPPLDYWNGQRLSQTLVPDNILLFSYSRAMPSLKESYGNYHPRFVLDLCVGGEALYHLAGKEYRIACGEAVLAFPHEPHGIHPVEKGKPLSRWLIVTFELKDSEAIASLRGSPRRLGAREIKLIATLQAAYQAGEPLSVSATLARLLRSLVNASPLPRNREQPVSSQPERTRFLKLVERHLDTHTTVADLAEATGYSEHQLKTAFRKYTQSTPADYIRRARLAKAARQLQSGEGTVTEIADRFGFSSVYAFSRMFKTVYGLPPKQYEKLGREGSAS